MAHKYIQRQSANYEKLMLLLFPLITLAFFVGFALLIDLVPQLMNAH